MSAPQFTAGRTIEHVRGEYVVRGGEEENRAVLARFGYARGVEATMEQAERLARELAAAPDLYAALNQIAAYNDVGASAHLESTGSYSAFDEPGAAQIARSALAQARGEVTR